MVRYTDMLSSNLHSYIFYGRRSTAFKLLFTLAEVMKGDVVRSIREKRCPYCGKKFESMRWLKRHLLTSSANCKNAFRADMAQIVEEYLKFKEHLVKVSYNRPYYKYKFREIPQPLFRNMDELCEWLKANGIPEFIK